MFLAAHLASCKVIEDCRDGQLGDQLKLVPTSPNHPSRKFRIIQLWDNAPGTVASGAPKNAETVLTRFITRDRWVSSKRRWPTRRPSPLKVDLMEEARKLCERFQQTLEEVRQDRAKREPWECVADDGLDPLPGETMKEYCTRVRPHNHQRW